MNDKPAISKVIEAVKTTFVILCIAAIFSVPPLLLGVTEPIFYIVLFGMVVFVFLVI